MTDLVAETVKALGGVLGAHGPATVAAPAAFAPGDFSIHFFLQMAVMIVTCRFVGWPRGVACYAAARLAGEDNRTALGIAALMNSRGLMELIIIIINNMGLQKGTIGPTLFAMLVLMAIVTTMMAGPLFEAVYGRRARDSGELGTDAATASAR